MGESKRHHYVPQHLLKNFSVENTKKQVWVLNKKDKKCYKTSILKAGSENHFNSYEVSGEKINFESYFDENDSNSAIIISKIIRNQNLQCLDRDEIITLSSVVVTQLYRTSFMRNTAQKLFDHTFDRVCGLKGFKPISEKAKELLESLKEYKAFKDNHKKFLNYLFLIDSIEDIKNVLTDKKIFLIKCPNKASFVISDNPVFLEGDDQLHSGPYGNVGLLVPKVRIYYPISSKLTLALFCPEVFNMIQYNLDSGIRVDEDIVALYNAMDKKGVYFATPDFVDQLNYYQLSSAERFAYGATNKFGAWGAAPNRIVFK